MILSDTDVTAALNDSSLEIDPLMPDQVQPASIDLTLGDTFLAYSSPLWAEDVVLGASDTLPEMIESAGPYRLTPGSFVLGSTVERVRLGSQLCAQVEGRSSVGRLGLAVHITAGFIDPGFNGRITLELYNFSQRTIVLTPGVRICQLSVQLCKSACSVPYGDPSRANKYQGQDGTKASLGV